MPRIGVVLIWATLGCFASQAQSVSPGAVQANGTATVIVNPPETAQVSVGVTTDGATADEAAQKNAAITTAVIAAVQAVLGTNGGTVQTSGYFIGLKYSPNQPPTPTGYIATNTLNVVSYSPATIGKLIDAATAAGANTTGGIAFGLRDPEPYIRQALTQASKSALARAAAIASGLGLKTGAVVSAQESSSYIPVVTAGGAGGTSSTPIVTGGVSVTGNVTINVQLIQ